MTEPLSPLDREVSDGTRYLLWPDAEIAWRCHWCRLVYSDPKAHFRSYPQCRS